MKFIVCGSYVDTMKALWEKQNPLYGRIDLTLNLKPMDSDVFYDRYIAEDFEKQENTIMMTQQKKGMGSLILLLWMTGDIFSMKPNSEKNL